MSYMIPVFAVVIDCQRLRGRIPGHDEAFEYLPEEYTDSEGRVIPDGCWESASHNWWYQAVVQDMCDAYPGFDEVRYLVEVVAVVWNDQLATKIDAIRNLLAAIRDDPKPFVACTSWYGANSEEVIQSIDEAIVSRDLDDETYVALSNFFSYIVSQLAALEEARDSGKCLLSFRPQPS
jgi:hypothetical protein